MTTGRLPTYASDRVVARAIATIREVGITQEMLLQSIEAAMREGDLNTAYRDLLTYHESITTRTQIERMVYEEMFEHPAIRTATENGSTSVQPEASKAD